MKTEAIYGKINLLYISPEKLINEIDYLFKRMNIALFAIDEAHCISQWGHDFRPTYIRISQLKRHFPNVPVMALTATADKVTCEDIIAQLNLSRTRIFTTTFDRPNLSLSVKNCNNQDDKLTEIISFLSRKKDQSGVIYCMSRKATEVVAAQLEAFGYEVASYHAGLSQQEREQNQFDFLTGKVQIICATIAFGMGIDKSDVRWVIHYNLPKSLECYYQEIGRAGRDGATADTLLIYSLSDMMTLNKFVEESGQSEINSGRLSRMLQYAESRVCRRRTLLSYFGEYKDSDCGNCDVCKSPPRCFDGSLLAQKALSAIARCDENIGFGVLVDILRGERKIEVIAGGYDKIKTFGCGSDLSYEMWERYLLQMLQLGCFEIVYNNKSSLRITKLGWMILKGEYKLMLAEDKRKSTGKTIDKVSAFRTSTKPPSALEKTLMLSNSGMSVKEIATASQSQPITVYSHLATLYRDGKLSTYDKFISEYEIDAVRNILIRFNRGSNPQLVCEMLGNKIEFGKVRLAIAIVEDDNE